MAVDLSEFEKLGRRDQREPCKIGLMLAKLEKAQRAKVDAALRSDSQKVRRGVIVWLKKRDLFPSGASIGSHRQGTCTCNG